MNIKKLFLFVFLGITILAIAVLIMIFVIFNNQRKLSHSEDIRFSSYLRAQELRQSSDDLTRLARTYVVTGNPKYEKMYWDILAIRDGKLPRPIQYEKIYWDYVSFDGKKPRPDGEKIPLDTLFKQVGITKDEFLKLKESHDNSDGLVDLETVAMNAVKGLFDDGSGNFNIKGEPNLELARNLMHSIDYHKEKVKIMEPIDDFFTLLDDRTKQTVEKYKAQSINYLFILIIFTVLLIFICLIGYVMINKMVIKKLGCDPTEIEDITSKISKGELEFSIDDISKQSVGVLRSVIMMRNSLNEMAKIAGYISNGDLTVNIKPQSDKDVIGVAFKTMVEKLRFQINTINEGINVISSSSSQIMSSSSQLAMSASQSASSIEETSVTVEKMRQNSVSISENGTHSVKEMTSGMNEIQNQMASIADTVVKLSELSQTIGQITATVNDIAEQSNLLAVNAAIEAAKAGEHGKGFAVVAQEIKNLAERSKNSTKQVRSVLNDIQKSISTAVMATEEGKKTVQTGLILSTEAGKSIDGLSSNIEETTQLSTQMEIIKETSLQIVAASNETKSSVNGLHNLGEKLNNIMKQYKLN